MQWNRVAEFSRFDEFVGLTTSIESLPVLMSMWEMGFLYCVGTACAQNT